MTGSPPATLPRLLAVGAAVPLLGAVACGPPATTISGTVAGYALEAPATTYFGGQYLFFADVELDCKDVAWVNSYYSVTEPPTDRDLVALQFTFVDDDVFPGLFSLAPGGPVSAKLLVLEGGAFSIFTARDGTLQVDEVTEKDAAAGSFVASFDDGELEGTYATTWCQNLPDT